RRPSAHAKHCGWPRSRARRRWDGRTRSDRSNRISAPTSFCSTSITSSGCRTTIPFRHSSGRRRHRASPKRASTAQPSTARAALSRWTNRRCIERHASGRVRSRVERASTRRRCPSPRRFTADVKILGPVVLPGVEGFHDLELGDDRIVGIRPSTGGDSRLALPAFADLHLHADRAFAAGPRPPRSLKDAAELVLDVKSASTEEAVRERSLRLLSRALEHGTLRVRTHVDVDPLSDERAIRGVLGARTEVSDRLDVQIVAFATKLCDPTSSEGRDRLVAAVEAGADVVGGVPAFHPDPEASVAALLRLARELGVPADLHVDETTDASALLLERLADETLALGLEGRVAPSHCSSLAPAATPAARRTTQKVATAGITAIVQPALNLYLQDPG